MFHPSTALVGLLLVDFEAQEGLAGVRGGEGDRFSDKPLGSNTLSGAHSRVAVLPADQLGPS